MKNATELLKRLLREKLDERITRLEDRAREQRSDLLYTREHLTNESGNVTKICEEALNKLKEEQIKKEKEEREIKEKEEKKQKEEEEKKEKEEKAKLEKKMKEEKAKQEKKEKEEQAKKQKEEEKRLKEEKEKKAKEEKRLKEEEKKKKEEEAKKAKEEKEKKLKEEKKKKEEEEKRLKEEKDKKAKEEKKLKEEEKKKKEDEKKQKLLEEKKAKEEKSKKEKEDKTKIKETPKKRDISAEPVKKRTRTIETAPNSKRRKTVVKKEIQIHTPLGEIKNKIPSNSSKDLTINFNNPKTKKTQDSSKGVCNTEPIIETIDEERTLQPSASKKDVGYHKLYKKLEQDAEKKKDENKNKKESETKNTKKEDKDKKISHDKNIKKEEKTEENKKQDGKKDEKKKETKKVEGKKDSTKKVEVKKEVKKEEPKKEEVKKEEPKKEETTKEEPKKEEVKKEELKKEESKKEEEKKEEPTHEEIKNEETEIEDIKLEDISNEEIKSEEENKEEEKKEEIKPEENKKEEEKKETPKGEENKPISSGSFNIQSFLTSPDSNTHIQKIFSYLTPRDIIAFGSSNKSLMKNSLLPYYNNLQKEIKETTGFDTEDKLNQKISTLTKKVKPEDLEEFKLSNGAEKALLMLNKEINTHLFKQEELGEKQVDVLIIYKLFAQLLNKEELMVTYPDLAFWSRFKKYFLEASNNQIGTFVVESAKNLDFSNKNIYKVQSIIHGKLDLIKPGYYNKICGTTGLMVFFIKDALEFSGIITKNIRTCQKISLRYTQYIQEELNKIDGLIKKIEGIN